MQSRTEPAICLGPTGKLQGSYWFLNLRTGRHIKRRTFTPPSVPTRVIDRVHALIDADNQNPALDFFDRLGNTIPNGDTPHDKNENNAKYPTGVEECDNNQHEITGVITQDHQYETPVVTTTEEEEEIQEIEIPEDEDENKEISGVYKNTEYPGVNIVA